MTAHTHTTFVPGCYRCNLNKDEVIDSAIDTVKEALRDQVGDGDGMDVQILAIYDGQVRDRAKLDLIKELLGNMYDMRYAVNEYPTTAVPKSVLLEHRNKIARESGLRP